MTTTIEHFEPNNISPEVLDLMHASLGDLGWTSDQLESEFQGIGIHYFALRKDNDFLSYLAGRLILDEFEILRVYTKPNYRKQALGKQLMSAFLEQTADQVADVFLEVRQHNEAAKALYTSMGFQQVAIRENYYSNPRDHALIMTLKNK